MMKALSLTALVLGLTAGSAFADRDRGRDHGRDRGRDRNTVVVRDHRGGGDWHRGDGRRGDWNRGGSVVIRDRGWHDGGRTVVRSYPRHYSNNHFVRRPIYVSRPVIRHRHYNYYQRPALIVENYNSVPGYYWVRGSWTWDGYEWVWTPGHYEPDPNYPTYYYDGYYNY